MASRSRCHFWYTIIFFKVCVISFGFYSTHYKVYIHLPWINTQQRTTALLDITPLFSYSYHQTPRLYQGSANRCEGDCNFNIICLLQTSQTIPYCNQSVLEIVPDLNIFVFIITIFGLILRSTLVHFFLLRVIYLYKSTGLRFYIFCSLPDSRLRYLHCHG